MNSATMNRSTWLLDMNSPDYLIVGTMKGGTTILHDFICEHPNVLSPTQKEIHYFSLFYHKGLEWYKGHFPETDSELVGEASPTYFDMATGGVIPRIIKRDFPDIKIILVVRDPVERAISHYNHLCKINKIESVEELGIERFFNMPYSNAIRCTTQLDTLLYHVLNFSCYSQKFKNYQQIFSDKLLVITNEQLREKSLETMDSVHGFLGLDARSSELFKKVKYSAGTSLSQVSDETRYKLASFLYPDYERFCTEANIECRVIADA